MGGGGEREGMVDGGGGLRVGKKIINCSLLDLNFYILPGTGAQEVCTLSNKNM